MPVREITRRSHASAISGLIPDLPRIGPELLDVPGMQEYDHALQDWWDQFKQSAVTTQINSDNYARAIEKSYETGDASLSARISTEETVRAAADGALASRTTTLEAQVQTPTTGLLARVTTIEGAYVDASGAYAQALSAIGAELSGPSGDIFASIEVESTARVNADTALATRTTTLESQVQTPTTGLLARVSVVESTKVDASGAYAQANSAISAALGGGGSITSAISASVSSEASARATADGYFASMYTLTAVSAGVIGGMKITAVSDPSGWTSYSEVRFQADRFTIYNGSSGLAPFQIVGSKIRFTGNVEIDGSLLLAGTLTVNYSDIGGTKPPSDADKTESALITGTTITGGGITLSAGGAIKGGASSFGSGTGFFLGYEDGQYKFRVGNPAGARIEWDGSAWTVVSFGGAVPTFSLTLGNSTGNPLYNPTPSPAGPYAPGQAVTITAPAFAGVDPFIKWSGSVPDLACIVDEFSPTTTVFMTHDISLVADY